MSSLAGLPVDGSNIHNLKDILETYNKVTESCFQKCVTSLNQHTMLPDEEGCVDRCSGKHINGNQRMIAVFMELQTKKQKQMMEKLQPNAAAAESENVASHSDVDSNNQLTTNTEVTSPEEYDQLNQNNQTQSDITSR